MLNIILKEFADIICIFSIHHCLQGIKGIITSLCLCLSSSFKFPDCCYFSHVIAVNGASVSYCWEGFSSDTGHVLLIDLSVLFVILFAVGLIHRGFIVTRSEKCSSLTRRESWSPVRAVVLFTIDYDRSSWLG